MPVDCIVLHFMGFMVVPKGSISTGPSCHFQTAHAVSYPSEESCIMKKLMVTRGSITANIKGRVSVEALLMKNKNSESLSRGFTHLIWEYDE